MADPPTPPEMELIRDGDDRQVYAFCRRYGPTLERLADRHLSPALRRRLDAEDVVQSVFRTFFRRAADGQFELDDDEGLWRLLCSITIAKVRSRARAETAAKRDVARQRSLEGATPLIGRGPDPAEEAAFLETMDGLLSQLDEEQGAIITMRLQGHTHVQVADAVGCSERTVRRMLVDLRATLERQFDGAT